MVLQSKHMFELGREVDDVTMRQELMMMMSNSPNEPVHEISNNVVCATSKASDQPAHTRSLIRAFACRLSIL